MGRAAERRHRQGSPFVECDLEEESDAAVIGYAVTIAAIAVGNGFDRVRKRNFVGLHSIRCTDNIPIR